MLCPICKGETRVTSSASTDSTTVRERTCMDCLSRFYTAERRVDESRGRLVLNRLRAMRKKVGKVNTSSASEGED